MDESKKEQAMRLFEAMEGVDPLLLERSEKAKKVVPIRKYTRMVAACLALLAVGGLSWYSLMLFGGKSANGATCEAPSAYTDNAQHETPNHYNDAVEQNACEGMEDSAEKKDQFELTEDESNKAAEAVPDMSAVEIGDRVEENTAESSVRGKTYYFKTMLRSAPDIREDVENYLVDKVVTLQIGGAEAEEKTLEYQYAAVLYMYLTELEIVPADASRGDGFEADVILRIADQQGTATEVWMIEGNLLKYEGLEDVYEIVDDRFDPDSFVEDVECLP